MGLFCNYNEERSAWMGSVDISRLFLVWTGIDIGFSFTVSVSDGLITVVGIFFIFFFIRSNRACGSIDYWTTICIRIMVFLIILRYLSSYYSI